MSTERDDENRYRIAIIDDDPLRARREVRELLAEIGNTDLGATLAIPRSQPADSKDKGGVSADLVGLLISGGSLVAASVQVWLARVPQRTILVSRPDGASLRITGREARADDERIERFLQEGAREGGMASPADAPRTADQDSPDGGGTPA